MIYVDALMDHGWRWGPSCHLFVEPHTDMDRLHDFARFIGLKVEWFQTRPGKMPHYDLTRLRRKIAINKGAVPLERVETVRIIRAWKEWPQP